MLQVELGRLQTLGNVKHGYQNPLGGMSMVKIRTDPHQPDYVILIRNLLLHNFSLS